MASKNDFDSMVESIVDDYYSGRKRYLTPSERKTKDKNLAESIESRGLDAYLLTTPQAKMKRKLQEALGGLGVKIRGGGGDSVSINPKSENQRFEARAKLRELLSTYSNAQLEDVAPSLLERQGGLGWGRENNADREILASLAQVFRERGEPFIKGNAEAEVDAQNVPGVVDRLISKLGMGRY